MSTAPLIALQRELNEKWLQEIVTLHLIWLISHLKANKLKGISNRWKFGYVYLLHKNIPEALSIWVYYEEKSYQINFRAF